MNSDKLQHGYARFLLTQGRTAGEFAAFKAGVEYAEGRDLPMPQTADQAEMMQKLGYSWLLQNAPDRLTKQKRDDQTTRPMTPAEQRAFARDIFLGPSAVDDSKSQLFMESKSEIQRRIERSQEALNRPLKDTVKLIPDCPNCECGIYPGNWCRDCPKHRNNGRAE